MNNFDLKAYMDVTPEIEEAVRTGKPVVALESTILSHGMPYPENLSFAREVEKIIREQGAIPATMAIIDGRLKCGLTEAELVRMCEAKGVLKVSRRDLPIVVAQKLTGATTVATTMILANMAGIHIFATGGIGGVHRHGEVTMDVSADLQELAHTPVAVVCAGAKMILDIGRTLEYLETMGVPVLGLNTDDFPAFYCRKSGFGVDYNAKTPADVAAIAKAMGHGAGGRMLIGNGAGRIRDGFRRDERRDRPCDGDGRRGRRESKNITPFPRAYRRADRRQQPKTNIQLAYNNARRRRRRRAGEVAKSKSI
ncbi:MAG: pseudouridine-5'-phosphate glycosidase [Christensenellales bacterium]